ncbi:MAG TPA: 4-hydroxy-tetrahydrodipicolinate reductase [Deltaproteobacteria bacterium]|nr:4-hydroxy-tetrahydrodipicolinate reductase [Deltaproteobacteria bacterium]
MLKVGVVGVGGRMGSLILQGILNESDMVLSGATERDGHPYLGKDAGAVFGEGAEGVKILSDPNEAFVEVDVIIDFSSPESTMKNLEFAERARKAMVIGTTGLAPGQKDRVESVSESIPVVMAPNMSVGVNVMFKVVGILANLLGKTYDCEIIEAHHRFKKDAPSGTAIGIAQEIAKARGIDLDKHARYERHGIIGERASGEIGIQSIRAGDIVGDHTVIFAANGERIELVHRAHSRKTFASGAIRAARWVAGRTPGLYSMKDVLGIQP